MVDCGDAGVGEGEWEGWCRGSLPFVPRARFSLSCGSEAKTKRARMRGSPPSLPLCLSPPSTLEFMVFQFDSVSYSCGVGTQAGEPALLSGPQIATVDIFLFDGLLQLKRDDQLH